VLCTYIGLPRFLFCGYWLASPIIHVIIIFTIEISKANLTRANVLGIVSTGVKLFATLIIIIFKTSENIPRVSQIIGLKMKSNKGFIKTLIRAKVMQNIISFSVPDVI